MGTTRTAKSSKVRPQQCSRLGLIECRSMEIYRGSADRRYDTEAVGLLLAVGILLVAAAGLIVWGAM